MCVVGCGHGPVGCSRGNYNDSTVGNCVTTGHLPVVILAGYLAMIGAFGLICLISYLRRAIDVGSGLGVTIFFGAGLAAATSLAVGWGLVTGIAVAAAEGAGDAKVPHSAT